MEPMHEVVPGVAVKPIVYAEHQPQYRQLPALVSRDNERRATHRWKLTWAERFTIFFGGSLWIQQLTFGSLLQPIKPSVECPLTREQAIDQSIQA